MRKRLASAGALLVPGLVFALLFFLNVCHHDHWLDSDMAAEMIFSRLLSEEGHLFAVKDWYYSTEFRFLYTQLLMGPLFHLSENWHLIRALTNILTYALMFYSYFYMMKPFRVKWQLTAITGTMLFLPFSETMITHMQMGNTYMPHVIILFFFYGLFLRLAENRNLPQGRGRWLFFWELLCFAALSVVCGVSGVRYLLAMQCPLAVTAFWYLAGSEEFGQLRRRFGTGEASGGFKAVLKSERASYVRYSLLGAVCSLGGYVLNVAWVSKSYVFQTYDATNFIAVYQGILWERLQNAIGSLLMLFGYIPDRGFLSLRGLISLISFVLIGIFVYCTVKACRQESGKRFFTALFVVTAFCINLFVFVFTTSTMVPRYYITIWIFVLPLLAFYWEGRAFLFDRYVVGALLAGCLLLSSAKITLSYLTTDKNEAKRPVAEFLADSDYTFGYATYWNGNIMTEMTDGAVEIANLTDPECLEYFKWSSPMKYYEEGYPAGEVFLLLTAEEAAEYETAPVLNRGECVYDDGNYIIRVYENAQELFDGNAK